MAVACGLAIACFVGAGSARAEAGTVIETAESLPFARGSAQPTVQLDSLAATIWVNGLKLEAKESVLCPRIDRRGGRTTLQCKSRRLRARIEQRGGRSFLIIAKLRGIPAIDGDASMPAFSYATDELGLPPCPATAEELAQSGPSVRGECAFLAGGYQEAISYLASALDQDRHPAHAALRLGDTALLVEDTVRAAAFWNSVGDAGPWTRLAGARLCDALGTCLEQFNSGFRYDPLDDGGLPDVVADEMLLRRARALAYDGILDEAVELLVSRGERACRRAPAMCRRIALEALRFEDSKLSKSRLAADRTRVPPNTSEAAAVALAVSLGLSDDPVSAELAARCAEVTARAGAPHFAANLLASATANKAQRGTPTLLRAAELYMEAGDAVRASMIVNYAQARPMTKELAVRWKRLANRIGANP